MGWVWLEKGWAVNLIGIWLTESGFRRTFYGFGWRKVSFSEPLAGLVSGKEVLENLLWIWLAESEF